MAIENFNRIQFEAVLNRTGKFECNGYDQKTEQLTYTARPVDGIAFAILIWSSLNQAGISDAGSGGDSIRAVISKNGIPYGGKSVRWVDRRAGWDRRLNEMLQKLTNQIKWLMSPCPYCSQTLVPLTATTPANKGRGFVCCKNEQCPGLNGNPKNMSFFAWTETEEHVSIPAPISHVKEQKVIKPTETVQQDAPICPICEHHPMVRMGSNKGWRCGVAGNHWKQFERKWSHCQGSIFDNEKPVKTTPVQQKPGSINLEQAKAIQNDLARKGFVGSAGDGIAEGMTPPSMKPVSTKPATVEPKSEDVVLQAADEKKVIALMGEVARTLGTGTISQSGVEEMLKRMTPGGAALVKQLMERV